MVLFRLGRFVDLFGFVRDADPEQSSEADEPRYNIAPTQQVAAVLNDGSGRVTRLRWGLIPSWAKDVSIGAKMINARSETAFEKPSFRNALRRRRCVVPVDGYYEWHRPTDGRPAMPYYIRFADDEPHAIAGLWERWNDPNSGQEIASVAVLTTRANASLAEIHDRMPVFLSGADVARWLDPKDVRNDEVANLFAPAADGLLAAHRVGRAVNRASSQGRALIEPITEDTVDHLSQPPIQPPKLKKEKRGQTKPDDGQGMLF
jgi:putative SOS response-associated peptidase YedK